MGTSNKMKVSTTGGYSNLEQLNLNNKHQHHHQYHYHHHHQQQPKNFIKFPLVWLALILAAGEFKTGKFHFILI